MTYIIVQMRSSTSISETLSGRLIAAITPLLKGSQAEVVTAAAEFELTLTQLRILFLLERADDDLAVNVLADGVGLSMAATGRAVDAMVRTGLLTRREDQSDRRIKRIGLTAAGRKPIVQISRARRQVVDRFVAKLDRHEQLALDAAIATLDALIARHIELAPSDTAGATARCAEPISRKSK